MSVLWISAFRNFFYIFPFKNNELFSKNLIYFVEFSFFFSFKNVFIKMLLQPN